MTLQPSLFASLSDNEHTVTLEKKPYIQPFENILASAELAGLLGTKSLDDAFHSAAAEFTTLTTPANAELLRKRLAYWQRVDNGKIQVTTQILYELSEDSSLDANQLTDGQYRPTNLPNRRKLRYGPHDLHEYRGKFFPQLVRSLINVAGLPRGSVVIDPMCGSGTTNCEARVIGMKTLGTDLNPLSVLVAHTKSALLDVGHHELTSYISYVLHALKLGQPRELTASLVSRWDEHNLEYLHRWFDRAALVEIEQILQVIEGCSHPTILAFLRICLSNILRSVSWQKDDDLRVRKEKTDYAPGTALLLFEEEIKRQTGKLSRYLALTGEEKPFAEFEIAEGDARQAHTILEQWEGQCDLLITSPPYATALPYLDTDRLSLVVLGLLPRSEHRDREYNMIGNREISEAQRLSLWNTYQRRKSELPQQVYQLIDEIALTNHEDGVGFRRRNLPALLSKYFLDMLDAMVSARRMMRPDRYAFYVVGNNSTLVDGVRVEIPTDKFLWEIGKMAGWHQEQFINMELLPSRDIFRKNRGSAESILMFRSTVKRASVYGAAAQKEHGISTEGWDFHDEDTREHLHTLHPYPARFIPQIPRKAIREYSNAGETILDPFCGSGTTLLESILLGRSAIGVDNNSVACLVSRVKTSQYSEEDLKLLHQHRDELSLPSATFASWIPDYPNRDHWFAPEALEDLGRIRGSINNLPEPARSLALAVLSSIIVRVSYQDSDTRYARVEKSYKRGSAIEWYQQRLRSILVEVSKLMAMPKATATVHLADGRDLHFIPDSSIHLIVTSPPYLNAYDYHKYHRHRLHWTEGDVAFARDQEIGKHDTFTRPKAEPQPYFDDMESCFKEWQRVLKPGGRCVIVIGDAIVSGQPVAVADTFINILQELGLPLKQRLLRNLLTSKKSFNSQARITQEHVLLLEKK